MRRAKLNSIYFAIIAVLAVVAAWVAADLPAHEVPMIDSVEDIASMFADRTTQVSAAQ